MEITAYNVRGRALTTPDSAGEQSTPTFKPTQADGNIMGISVGQNYSPEIMGKMLITLQAGEYRPFENVPLTQLLPTNERPFFMLGREITVGEEVDVKITALTNDPDSTNPVYLITHHSRNL